MRQLENTLENTVVGHYTVGRELGRGAEGVVYQATDTRTNSPVALKFLSQPTAELQIPPIDHPRILQPLEAPQSTPDGYLYFPLRLMKQNLRQFLGQGRSLPIDQAVQIIHDCADALILAHQHHLHLDLKPENILLDEHNDAYVADWGLAQPQSTRHSPEARASAAGTWTYMAPEMLRKYAWLTSDLPPEEVRQSSIGATADIYSLGLVLYELLTGSYAFGDRQHETTLEGRLHDLETPPDSPLVLRPSLPPGLAKLCTICLQTDPAQRIASGIASATDLKSALAPFLSPLQPYLKDLIDYCQKKTRRYSRLAGIAESRSTDTTQLLPPDWAEDSDLAQLRLDWIHRHDRQNPRQSEKVDDILLAFNKTKRAALLGDPGAGKSTMLRRLALDFAQSARNDDTNPLPVLVELGGWTEPLGIQAYITKKLPSLRPWLDLRLPRRPLLLLLEDRKSVV